MKPINPESFYVYKFDELSEEAQQTAIRENWDWNVEIEWWDGVYEDAENIGLKITGFDIGCGQATTGDWLLDPIEVCEKILSDHGEQCETHRTVLQYKEDLKRLIIDQCQNEADFLCLPLVRLERYDTDYYRGGYSLYEIYYCQDDIDTEEIDYDFKNSLLGDYLLMLSSEYDYLTSEEVIKESLISNEMDFTEDGEIY